MGRSACSLGRADRAELASAAKRAIAGMKDADFGGLIVCSVKKVAIALTDMVAFAA